MQEKIKDDMIKRQAAIDALEKMSANYTGLGEREWHPHVRECQYELKMLPSAQPEQLDEWLEQLKRADTLLTATYDLLQKQYKNIYVLNLLAETINYDEAECDGNCLMEDIEAWMIERGIGHDE